MSPLVWALSLSAGPALAEGSDELGLPVSASTTINVDLDDPTQRVTVYGTGRATITPPKGGPIGPDDLPFGVFGYTGVHTVVYEDTQTEDWEILVEDASGSELTGRVWSSEWVFDEQPVGLGADGHLYAPVASGDGGHVIYKVDLAGVAGDQITIVANSSGIDGAEGRSRPESGKVVSGDQPLYLSYPAEVQLSEVTPGLSDVKIDSTHGACDAIVEGYGALVQFTMDYSGVAHVLCELSGGPEDDGIWDMSSAVEHFGGGWTDAGVPRSLPWDGTGPDGFPESGLWRCVVRATSAELHLLIQDAETVFPGLAIYRLDNTQSPQPHAMYWNDDAVQDYAVTMLDGQTSLSASGPDGVTSDPVQGPGSNLSAHAWGDLGETSKGDAAWMDTWTWAAESTSAPIDLYFFRAGVDADGDGLADAEEYCIHGTKYDDPDSDGDGYGDGEEIDVLKSDPLDPDDPGGDTADTAGDTADTAVDTSTDTADTALDTSPSVDTGPDDVARGAYGGSGMARCGCASGGAGQKLPAALGLLFALGLGLVRRRG